MKAKTLISHIVSRMTSAHIPTAFELLNLAIPPNRRDYA